MLFLSPTVFILSMYTAVTYGLSYLLLTTLSKVMIDAYGLNQGIVGLSFLGIGISISFPYTLRLFSPIPSSHWESYRVAALWLDF